MSGRLAPEVIQRVIRDSYKQLRACYEKGLAKNPTLTGRVQVRFTIQRDGTVSKVTEENSTLPDPDVIHCILPEYEKLKFPKPDGGAVTVVYPIMFSPEEN
jgi:Ca-activated chloride channel family protein